MPDVYPPLIKRDKVGGVAVVKDEVLASGLTEKVGRLVPLKGTRKLTLADGTVTYGCADCLTHGTRGEVGMHRAEEHPPPAPAKKRGPGRPGRGDAKAASYSAELRDMTFGELLELAVLAADSEAQFARLEARIEELEALLAETTGLLHAEEKAHKLLANRLKKLVEG